MYKVNVYVNNDYSPWFLTLGLASIDSSLNPYIILATDDFKET